jgi:hypothetical protein
MSALVSLSREMQQGSVESSKLRGNCSLIAQGQRRCLGVIANLFFASLHNWIKELEQNPLA